MDGAAPDTRLNAQRKAYTAARSDARSTRELAEKARDDPVERASFDPFFTFFLGGVAVFEDEVRVGARRRQRSFPASRTSGSPSTRSRLPSASAWPRSNSRPRAWRGHAAAAARGDGTSQPSESARRTIMLKSAATWRRRAAPAH
jgi:hypothetical protein